MKQIAIFASGSGSNAECILEHFASSTEINVALILTNNTRAGVIARGEKWKVPVEIIPNSEWKNSTNVLPHLEKYEIEFVVLAGFLRKIPNYLIAKYPNQIVNIHPALLPQYGGKGMYGMYVHQAVFEAGESMSGMTIHLVNEVYDAGEIVFQATCEVSQAVDAQAIQAKVLELEHRYFPIVVEYLVKGEMEDLPV